MNNAFSKLNLSNYSQLKAAYFFKLILSKTVMIGRHEFDNLSLD